MCSEADIDLLDHEGVVLEEVLLDRSGCDAHKAETMKDWSLKSSHSCHFRVNMQRIHIVAKSVENGLIRGGLLLTRHVSCSLRHLRERILHCALVSEAADTSDEEGGAHRALQRLCSRISDLSVKNQHCALTFIL